MTEKRDADGSKDVPGLHPAGKPGDQSANDADLPRPEDILPNVLSELKRHARVLRRVAERAMDPKKLGDEDTENR